MTYEEWGKCDQISRENVIKRFQPWDKSDVGIIKDFKSAIIPALCEVKVKPSWNEWKDKILRREIETIKKNQMEILEMINTVSEI